MEVGKTIKILASLADIELPKDATEAGFGKINEALSMIGSRTMHATRISCDVHAELADLGKQRTKAKIVLDLKRADLQANDEEVKAGKNEAQRKAIADVKLASHVSAAEKADMKYQQIQAVNLAARDVLSALKASKEIAGHLLNVTQKEMDLGLVTQGNIGN